MVLAANGDEFLSVIRPQFAKHLYGARSPNSSLEKDGTLVDHIEADIRACSITHGPTCNMLVDRFYMYDFVPNDAYRTLSQHSQVSSPSKEPAVSFVVYII